MDSHSTPEAVHQGPFHSAFYTSVDEPPQLIFHFCFRISVELQLSIEVLAYFATILLNFLKCQSQSIFI